MIIMANWIQYIDDNETDAAPSLRQFLELCWPSADEITLSSYFDLSMSPRLPLLWERRKEWEDYKAYLRPWLVGTTISGWWFGYGRGSTKMTRYRYRAEEGLKEALCTLYRDIFLRSPMGQHAEDIIYWFEDLCLFSRKRLFFGSISHEHEAFLYPLIGEMREAVSSLGEWEDCLWRDERSRIHINTVVWKKQPPILEKAADPAEGPATPR